MELDIDMDKHLNVFAFMTTISLMISITSCSISNRNSLNVKRSGSLITPDSPWYYGEVLEVDLGIDKNRTVESLRQSLAGVDSKSIYIFTDGRYKVDWNTVKSNTDFAIKNISIIDRATRKTHKIIDLYTVLDSTDWPEQAIYSNEQLIVKCESWDSKSDTYSKKDYYINLETEKVIGTYEFELDYNLQYWGSYSVGEFRIESICDLRSEKEKFLLRVYSSKGFLTEIEIKEPEKDIFDIPVILALNDNTALIPAAMERDYTYYTLDLNTYKVSTANARDFEWLDLEQLTSSHSENNGIVFASSPQGITKIDIQNKKAEPVLDYSWCAINRQYLTSLRVADVSGDSFLLCGQYHSSDMFSSLFVNNLMLIEFTKADKNPHAGKTIIELYLSGGEVDETIGNAIIKYNESNEKYYIEISSRYNKNDYFNPYNIGSKDDYDIAWLHADAELSNDLAMDIMNGEGPDILMNTSSLGQLNNDNYLIDLSTYITSLSPDKYFGNIIEGSRINGKVYQLPISFTIEGIQTDPQYAGKTGIGFTTEEYESFLYNTLNGKDVIEYGQPQYFSKLFNGMQEEFIQNGKADFTGQKYATLAAYVKENVQQRSIPWNYYDENLENQNPEKTNRIAYYCNCPSISGYLVKRAQIKNGSSILGIPSDDGRGPMFGNKISIAVSTRAVNINACVDFVKILLSDEIQSELVMEDKLVINRAAFRQGCNAAIRYFNTAEGSQNMFDYAAGTYVTSHMKFTSEDIDNLESVILSCSKINSADSAINAILIEEMPAYFLGQKDLDSVVVIIQDRAQKVLDERG